MAYKRLNLATYHVWTNTAHITRVYREPLNNNTVFRVKLLTIDGSTEQYDFDNDTDAMAFINSIVGVQSVEQKSVLRLVELERDSQDIKWGSPWSRPEVPWLAILTEEIGEVGTAIQNNDEKNLKNELVQVAAVAVAWLETMD